jgi:hypothetical protein
VRAHIVLAALQTQNRFTLCHLAFKSIRKLHKPNTRIQDTANDVLQRLAGVEEQPAAAASANPTEDRQEQFAIAAQLPQQAMLAGDTEVGAPPAEALAEAVDPDKSTVISPAESPESQV